MLQVNDLTKFYGHKQVLKNINFSLKQGEVLGILGPNGSGKTTMLKIICGLISPSSGSLVLQDISPLQIATIFEDQRFLNYLSGIKNIKLFFNHFNDGITRDYNDLFIQYGLGKSKELKYKFYSSGMKRRLDLMSIFSSNKTMYLLDEPTNTLDIDSIHTLNEQINSLKKENKAFIISSHHTHELEKLCDRFLIINNGEIVTEIKKSQLVIEGSSLENEYRSIISNYLNKSN